MAVVNSEEKWVFVCEPHTASRGTKAALLELPGSREVGNHHIDVFQIMKQEDILGFDTICTVRNPLDTVVSRWRLGKGYNRPFKEWVQSPDSELKSKWFGHYRFSNIVCWFENLRVDLNYVFQRAVPLLHNPKHKTLDKDDWSCYYDEESFKVVTELYSDYIEEFGYQLSFANGRASIRIDESTRKKRLHKIGYGRSETMR